MPRRRLIFALFVLALVPSIRQPGRAAAAESPGFIVAERDTLTLVEEIVVWGDRVRAVTEQGTRVDVIPKEQVEAARHAPGATALDAARALPGVAYQRVGLVANGASGDPPAGFRIRGVGAIPNDGLLVLVDGRPQYVGVWGHSLPDAHRLGGVERIEVVRGPAAVQFGSQAFGGVVNIVTAGGAEGTTVRAVGADHATYEMGLDHRGSAGPLTGLAAVSRAGSDGYRGGDAARVDALRLGLDWAARPGWRVEARVDGTETEFDNPGPESAPYADPRQGSGTILQRAADLTVRGEGSDWSARLMLYRNYVHNDFWQAGDTRAGDSGLRLAGERRRTDWSLKGGFDLERYGGTFTINGDTAFVPIDAHDVNAAPYVMGSARLSPRLIAASGVRVNFSDRYATEWVPQGRLIAALGERASLTLSAAKGFKTPAVAQQYLPFFAGDRNLLAPERIWQYEVGLSRRWAGGDAGLSLYQAEGSNLIRLAVPSFPAPVYDNGGAFRHRGLEATLRQRLLRGGLDGAERLSVALAASWMLERGEQTLLTPGGAYQLSLTAQPASALAASLSLAAETSRYGADGHRASLPDLLLTSLGVSWELPWRACECPGAGGELFVQVDNLADVDYRMFADYPMPGRLTSIGFRLSR